MFLDHIQRRTTVGRTPLGEWSARLEESYRLCCVVVCDLETSRIGAPCIYIYTYDISSLRVNDLTLILLTWRKLWANNASKQQVGFNSAFKGLKLLKKTRERAFKQFKWPRPQCVNSARDKDGWHSLATTPLPPEREKPVTKKHEWVCPSAHICDVPARNMRLVGSQRPVNVGSARNRLRGSHGPANASPARNMRVESKPYNHWYYQELTLRRLMLYMYGAPILDVSRSHTTTQHSR